LVVALFRDYGVGGVLSLMIGLLCVQIVVVMMFGIEPKKRRLEEIGPDEFRIPVRAKAQ
jgi:putative MFS transporter